MTITVSKPSLNVRDDLNLAKGAYKNAWGPAFHVYGSGLQTSSNATWLKIAFNTKNIDTNNCFDTTLYRFTPTVAGLYQVNFNIVISQVSTGVGYVNLYKNGQQYSYGSGMSLNVSTANSVVCSGSTLVSMNGTTDYLEVYGYQTSGGSLTLGSNGVYFSFSGSFARGV